MALTNFELYEELKKDLSEKSARMIAEIVPLAGDLTTKSDFAGLHREFAELRSELKTDFAALEVRFAEVEARMERRMSSFERRFFLMFALPLWSAVAAGIVKLYIG